MSDHGPLLGVTMGDPSGIGPEIIAAGYGSLLDHARIVVYGDAGVIERAITTTGTDRLVRAVDDPAAAGSDPSSIDVLDFENVADHAWGVIGADYGEASLAYVEAAIEDAMAGRIDGFVTAPIHKQAIARAGGDHAGHTGLIADRTGTEDYSMLLIEEPLRVSHVSTHVPLREAVKAVTTDRVSRVIELTHATVTKLGVTNPRVGVAGLNPHAGDGGVLGEEDDREIRPAVQRTRAAGIDAAGPVSGDTIFTRALQGEFDCVVAMYHDQGHIPVKLRGFDDGGAVTGVNVTIGVPIVRTSVDHGTAFDIAGTGSASHRSLSDAVRVATRLAAAEQEGSG